MRTLVAILLYLFPAPFRKHYRADLLATFEQRWRVQASLALAARTVADLVRSAFLERIARPHRAEPRYKGDGLMKTIWQDLRFGARVLTRSPGFSIAAIVTLALGIGANSAIYSVVDAVLFKGLPYPHADRLVVVNESLPNTPFLNASWPDYQDWRAQNQVFTDMAVFQQGRVSYVSAEGAKSAPAGWASASLFSMLGARPLMGRVFGTADDHPGAPPVAVVSYRFWRNELKGDAEIVGKQVPIGGGVTVVGVLDPGFGFEPFDFDVYLPVGPRSVESGFTNRGNHPGLFALALLQPDVSLSRAQADMHTIMDRLARSYPESNRNEQASLTPIADRLIGHFRAELLMLLGAVALVLLIACANVAHLMLAHAAGRRREFAIRTAIGASRARLIRQSFVESALLALAGGTVGLILAYWCLPALVTLYPGEIPGLRHAHLNLNVFLFTLTLCLVSGALFGLAPVLQTSPTESGAAIKIGSGTGGRHGGRFRAVLFVAEIATALVLTVGGALMVRSLIAVLDANPGFRADHLLALDIVRQNGGTPEGNWRFFEQAAERLGRQPGVESASAVMCPPLSGACWTSPYAVVGRAAPPPMQRPWTALNMVLPRYFETMRTSLKAGRLFDAQDDGRAGNVAIVNQTLAHRAWPQGGALGQRIDVTYAKGQILEVVGIIDDVKQFGLDTPAMEEVYVPAAQMPVNFMTVMLRTRNDPATLMRAAASVVQDLDKGQPVARIAPMTASVADSVARRRFAALLLGLFSGMALVLAMVGVAGVMGNSVAQRTREFGIRMAMGAQPGQVLRQVLGYGFRLTLAGVTIGLIAAWGFTRLLVSMLFDVRPHDTVTFAAVAAVLAAAALMACLIPALRAARVDPMTALRHD